MYFLNYDAYNQDTDVSYHVSDLILQTDSNAAYFTNPWNVIEWQFNMKLWVAVVIQT